MIEIYSDGAYDPISNNGGWGVVIVQAGNKQLLSGIVENTTNNRMELTATLEGILHTPQGSEVVVYTDSQYLFGCVTKGWQRRANRDLWEQLDEAINRRNISWEWVNRNTRNLFHREAHTLASNLVTRRERL